MCIRDRFIALIPDFHFLSKRLKLVFLVIPFLVAMKINFLSETAVEDIIGDLYVIGGFNNYELSEEFKLLETSKNTYVTELLLKQGFYNYKYVVKNNNLISDISNFWQTENEYTAFLYEKKPSDRFYKIIGYANKNSLKIVN